MFNSSVTVGERELQLLANAATPLLYKQLFKTDLMRVFSGMDAENIDTTVEVMNLLPSLCYVMNKQAEDFSFSSFNKLTEADYISWLCDFGPMDFTYAAEEILNVYLGTSKATSISKKKVGKVNEK